MTATFPVARLYYSPLPLLLSPRHSAAQGLGTGAQMFFQQLCVRTRETARA